jgi:hypothetical protein
MQALKQTLSRIFKRFLVVVLFGGATCVAVALPIVVLSEIFGWGLGERLHAMQNQGVIIPLVLIAVGGVVVAIRKIDPDSLS